MKPHFEELALWVNDFFPEKKLSILEIGSNDGSLMDCITMYGHLAIGVDPARNVCELAWSKGHKVYCEYFSEEFVHKNELEESFDVVISTNSFAHISNTGEIVRGLAKALKQSGRFIVEVQFWPQLVQKRAFDFVYHEHKFYYD